MSLIAPRRTRYNLGSARVISASTITVFGIVLTTTAGAAVTVDFRESSASGDIILTVLVPDDETVVIDIPFLADNGLYIVKEASTTIVTVFHGTPGA